MSDDHRFFGLVRNMGRPIDADVEKPEPNGHDSDRPRRFQFTRFCDIRPNPEPAYTVDKMIPRRGVVVIWGKPKCGKTFWTFDLEMHVALGWLYRGQRSSRARCCTLPVKASSASPCAKKRGGCIISGTQIPKRPS
jgi:hypothetical protein